MWWLPRLVGVVPRCQSRRRFYAVPNACRVGSIIRQRERKGSVITAVPAPSPARFAGLDGLRALAVTLVLVFHLSPGALVGGYLGVDIFFVISGFLITSLLLREHAVSGRIRLGQFWRRRARRLLPALGVLLVVCCSAAWVIGGDVLVRLSSQVLGAVTFSSNWLAISAERSYFDGTSPELFRNLWSLAVEEQFYLLWPLLVLLLLLIRRPRIRMIAVAAAAVLSAAAMAVLYVDGGDPTRVYYGTDTHSFGLTGGAVLALVMSPRMSRFASWGRLPRVGAAAGAAAGAIILGCCAVWMSADTAAPYRGGLALVTIATGAVIFAAALPGARLGRMLDVAPMRWIGERSYGLYLWHWPLYVLLESLFPAWPRVGAAGWALGGVATALAVVCAALSYRFVEHPIRRHGFRAYLVSLTGFARASRRHAFFTAAATCVFVLGMAGSALALVAEPGQSAAQQQIEEGQRAVDEAGAAGEGAQPEALAPPEPDVTEQPAEAPALPPGTEITAVGDSVMLASAPELQSAFPGISIDAVVSRQLSQAPAILAGLRDTGALRSTVLIGLGTNGPIDAANLTAIRDIAGPDRTIVFVTVYAPRWWTDGVNAELTRFAATYRNVELADWQDAIDDQLGLLARDQIHPGNDGGRVYTDTVREALLRLAALPPLLDTRDYGLAPVPE